MTVPNSAFVWFPRERASARVRVADYFHPLGVPAAVLLVPSVVLKLSYMDFTSGGGSAKSATQ
jgi:hypothetical protein